jgi:protein-S-isoprenylcysteine O-methyltransferase Ste14
MTTPSSLDTAGVIAPPPLFYVIGLALGLIAQHFYPQPVLPSRVSRVVGLLLIVIALVNFVGAVLALHRAETSPKPWRPTTALVISGPYRWTRNPIYLAFTLVYLGITAWVNTVWPLVLLPLVLFVMHRGVILREEAYLEQKFGDEYRRYKNDVYRWFGWHRVRG